MKNNTSFIQYSASLLFMIILHHATQAQFAKGSFLIGGEGSYQSRESTYRSSLTFSKTLALYPKVGYFVANRFAIGAGVGISVTDSEVISGSKFRNEAVSFLPFIRYYISNLYIQTQGGGGLAKAIQISTATTKVFYTSDLSMVAGYALFLTPVVALEAQVGYEFYSNNIKPADPQYANLKQSDFLLNVGLQFYLKRKE